MTKRLIQKGNSKLATMYMFNLPATKEVCKRICKGCYAVREQTIYPTVLPARKNRYAASLDATFVQKINTELSKIKNPPKYFRIHASGEFYSQSYINKWTSIVQSNPNITFYAYTKRLTDFDFTNLKTLPNMVLINSFHYGRLNYAKKENIPPNAYVCPHQKGVNIECGVDCTWCMEKGKADLQGIFFVKH